MLPSFRGGWLAASRGLAEPLRFRQESGGGREQAEAGTSHRQSAGWYTGLIVQSLSARCCSGGTIPWAIGSTGAFIWQGRIAAPWMNAPGRVAAAGRHACPWEFSRVRNDRSLLSTWSISSLCNPSSCPAAVCGWIWMGCLLPGVRCSGPWLRASGVKGRPMSRTGYRALIGPRESFPVNDIPL